MLNYTMSEKAKALFNELTAEVAKCEELRIAGKAYAGKDEQLDTCRDKARELNKAISKEICEAYAAMAETDPVGVVRNYFDNWFFEGYKVSQHSAEDGGDVYVDATNIRIPFSAVDGQSKKMLTNNGAWRKYLTIFADNCVRFNSTNEKDVDGKTKEKAVFAKDALPADLLKLRNEREGWSDCSTKNALAKQLNDLVGMIMPEEMSTKMLKADCRSFMVAMADLKRSGSMTDAGINFAVKNAKTLEEILFRHIMARRNNLATKYDMGYKQENTSETGRNPELNGKPAEGGPVTGETAPAEQGSKPTAKENAAA